MTLFAPPPHYTAEEAAAWRAGFAAGRAPNFAELPPVPTNPYRCAECTWCHLCDGNGIGNAGPNGDQCEACMGLGRAACAACSVEESVDVDACPDCGYCDPCGGNGEVVSLDGDTARVCAGCSGVGKILCAAHASALSEDK